MLKVLAELSGIELCQQVIDSAVGMHGAGKYRAQCGLVEGALMFIGVFGRDRGYQDDETIAYCFKYASEFEKCFESLTCRDLRPGGFRDDDPPHLCEDLSKRAVEFAANFIKGIKEGQLETSE